MDDKKFLSAIISGLLGMLAVLLVVSTAAAGYKFGQYLAQSKNEATTQTTNKPNP